MGSGRVLVDSRVVYNSALFGTMCSYLYLIGHFWYVAIYLVALLLFFDVSIGFICVYGVFKNKISFTTVFV